MSIKTIVHRTQAQLHADAVDFAAHHPSVVAKPLHCFPDHRYEFEVFTSPDSFEETFSVDINLVFVDEVDGVDLFDVDITAHNNDNASLRDIQRGINEVIDLFYSRGYHTAHGKLIGEHL